jgi:hypothetical protein
MFRVGCLILIGAGAAMALFCGQSMYASLVTFMNKGSGSLHGAHHFVLAIHNTVCALAGLLMIGLGALSLRGSASELPATESIP